MHSFIGDLRREHGEIITLMKILSAEVHRIAGDEVPNYRVMHDVLFYMTRYPDLFHHPKEELLFDRLLALTDEPRELIAQLRGEHVETAAMGTKLLELLRSVLSEQVVSQREIYAALSDYVRGQRFHITKEETEVFRLAEDHLTEADWHELDQRIATDFSAFSRELSARYARMHRDICAEAVGTP